MQKVQVQRRIIFFSFSEDGGHRGRGEEQDPGDGEEPAGPQALQGDPCGHVAETWQVLFR